MNPSKSGSSPRSRCSSMWLSSASMSFMRWSCSGDISDMPCCSWLNIESRSCFFSSSISSSNCCRAASSIQSYCWSSLTRPARSGGSCSSSWRRSLREVFEQLLAALVARLRARRRAAGRCLRVPVRRSRRAVRRSLRRRRRGRSGRAARGAARAASRASRADPWTSRPSRSVKPCCIIRRSAALRSPW